MIRHALPTDGDDAILDLAYDFYGSRLASTSVSGVTIWTRAAHSADGELERQASWKAHHGPVTRVSWAHPAFGQLLATASADHNVCIWEEQEGVLGPTARSTWSQKALLGDARGAVNDVQFAPKHLGLKVVRDSAASDVAICIVEQDHICDTYPSSSLVGDCVVRWICALLRCRRLVVSYSLGSQRRVRRRCRRRRCCCVVFFSAGCNNVARWRLIRLTARLD